MKKNTFFSIISTRQRMHTYLGSNFQDSLSMSEINGAGPVKLFKIIVGFSIVVYSLLYIVVNKVLFLIIPSILSWNIVL